MEMWCFLSTLSLSLDRHSLLSEETYEYRTSIHLDSLDCIREYSLKELALGVGVSEE